MEINQIPVIGQIIRMIRAILGSAPKPQEKQQHILTEPATRPAAVTTKSSPASQLPTPPPVVQKPIESNVKAESVKPAPPTKPIEQPKQESKTTSLPAETLSDYENRCRTILGETKTLDMVMITDSNGRILIKVEKQLPQSSIRRFSPEEIAKLTLRANITKGAFNVDAPTIGQTSLVHIQYNAMDMLLYPLENNFSLLAVGMIDPLAIPEASFSITSKFPSKVKMAIIVDDEQDILNTISQVLVQRGFRVETASSGPDALAIIEKGREKGIEYGMAILDIRMPGMDGIELFKRISKVSPNTKMIMITAFEYSEGDVGRMVSTNNITVLKKPFKRSDLLQAITSVQS